VRSFLAVTAAAATCAGLLLTAAPAQAAASPIQFGKIQYDSPGSDNGSNLSINAEYVVIRNTSTRSVSLTGWTVRDALPTVYRFGTFTLGPGKSLVLRTGKGAGSTTTRYWGMSRYVWNNPGDTAVLKNASGVTQDVCRWTVNAPGYTPC
jgi:hypothetical protein